MYKTSWGKVGEEILKKRPKITQMFDMLKYPKVIAQKTHNQKITKKGL